MTHFANSTAFSYEIQCTYTVVQPDPIKCLKYFPGIYTTFIYQGVHFNLPWNLYNFPK